jgi:hypothetical protein
LLGRLMAILISSRGKQSAPMATAKEALIAYLAFLKDDPRRARIMLVDAMGINEGSTRGAQAAARDYVGAIQAFLDLLYPRMAEQQLSSRTMAAMLSGACIHVAKEWINSSFEAPLEAIAAHLVVMFEALDGHYQRALAVQAQPK